MAPAAGPGWEEPTSQLYPRLRTELDYVFTLPHEEGSAYDDQAFKGTPEFRLSRSVGTDRVPFGILELAARPSHYARLLRAQSLRGHNGWSCLADFRWHPGCRSFEIFKPLNRCNDESVSEAAGVAGLVDAVLIGDGQAAESVFR